jgi:hypothetical protein
MYRDKTRRKRGAGRGPSPQPSTGDQPTLSDVELKRASVGIL